VGRSSGKMTDWLVRVVQLAQEGGEPATERESVVGGSEGRALYIVPKLGRRSGRTVRVTLYYGSRAGGGGRPSEIG